MRAGRLILVALLGATAAGAQNTSTTTIPAPSAERYSLPPGNSQTTPAPVPSVAVPTLTPAAPPSVVPTLTTPRPTPSATPTRAAPTPRPTPAPTSTPTAVAPSPTAAATPIATVTPTLVASGTPAPTPVETTAAPPPAVTPSGPPSWLWWVVGLAVLAIGGLFAWRRLGRERNDPIAYAPEPAPLPAPTPSPPARPVAAPKPDRALVLDFRPQRLWTRGPDAHLAFELVVTNGGTSGVDAVRPVIALASAGPDTVAEITSFNARSQTMPSGEPFDLRAGETRTISGELTLPGDRMYVTSAADRELIVPLALVNLHWRDGLSVKRADEAFVIGTGDATAQRLGPIWVDRAGLVYAKLDARRFTPGPA